MDLYEYIKLYDKAFNTHIYEDVTEKEFPMIEKIFYDLGEEIYIPGDKHKHLAQKREIISDKILKLYTSEQEQLFSDYLEIQCEMDTDINKQMLIVGFCICYQQLKEMNALK